MGNVQADTIAEQQGNAGSFAGGSSFAKSAPHSFLTPQDLEVASSARILVAISFHFLPKRLGYLEKVLSSFASFPVESCEIVVFTNTEDSTQQDALREVFGRAGFTEGRNASIHVARNLDHPFDLTWQHKSLIKDSFLAANARFSHFIYLEDDEELSFAGFAYFLAARKILRNFGLLPGLVRVEWKADGDIYVSADNIAPVDLTTRPFVGNGVYAFLEPQNVYYGGFILDQELAREYVATRSFDLHKSVKVTNWMVRERSAMGLTFEKIPRHFAQRVVVPVSMASRTVPECAWLPHLPNKFVASPNTPFGKLPMTRMFSGSFIATCAESQKYELQVKLTWPIVRSHVVARGKRRVKTLLRKLFPLSARLG